MNTSPPKAIPLLPGEALGLPDEALGLPDKALVFPAGLPPRGHDPFAMLDAIMLAQPGHKLGHRGPALFDCWSMSQVMQMHLAGRVLKNVDLGARPSRTDVLRAVRKHPARHDWAVVDLWNATGERPQHLDMIEMAHGDTPWHVGVFLDIERGLVAHHAEHAGLCVDDRVGLLAKGYSRHTIYRFRT